MCGLVDMFTRGCVVSGRCELEGVCGNGKVWTQYMGLWDVGHKGLGTLGCRNVRTQGCDKQTSPDFCAKN